jgi:hypothetical protein
MVKSRSVKQIDINQIYQTEKNRMALTIQKSQDKTQLPAGIYYACCIQVIDLGTQYSEHKNEGKWQAKFRLVFEILGSQDQDTEVFAEYINPDTGKHKMVGRDFTPSFYNESNLKVFLRGWNGRELTTTEEDSFNASDLRNRFGKLQIVRKPRKADPASSYELLNSIVSCSKAEKAMAENQTLHHPIFTYDIETDGFNFSSNMTDFTIGLIKKSKEYGTYSLNNQA